MSSEIAKKAQTIHQDVEAIVERADMRRFFNAEREQVVAICALVKAILLLIQSIEGFKEAEP